MLKKISVFFIFLFTASILTANVYDKSEYNVIIDGPKTILVSTSTSFTITVYDKFGKSITTAKFSRTYTAPGKKIVSKDITFKDAAGATIVLTGYYEIEVVTSLSETEKSIQTGNILYESVFSNPEIKHDQLETMIINEINRATKSIDLALYNIRSAKIIDALINAASRIGVNNIRLATEYDNYTTSWNKDFYDRIQNAGIKIVTDVEGGGGRGLSHNKFIIFDNARVITGSYNPSYEATYFDNNNSILIQSVKAASIFKAEFEQMFKDKKFGTAKNTSIVTQFDYTKEYSNVTNLNTATKTQLSKLTGISSGAAANIVAYRDKNKGFKSLEELKNVTGITNTNYPEIHRYLYLPENENKINLNTANKTQIQTISGVGSVIAQRIIDYRNNTAGGFKDITELNNISGISAAMYSSIKNYVTVVDGPFTFLGEVYFSPKDKIRDKIIHYINTAEYSIEFALFTFTDNDITAALINAKKRGVNVRGVFETAQTSMTGCAYTPLKTAGLKVYKDKNSYCLHHKYAIIDGRVVITGSYNWTASANSINDENIVILKDKASAIKYYEDFKKVLP